MTELEARRRVARNRVWSAIWDWNAAKPGESAGNRAVALDAALDAFAAIPAPQPAGETVEVRAALAMTRDGSSWAVIGKSDWTDAQAETEVMEGCSVNITFAGTLTARAPLPSRPVIAATVELGA